MSLNLAVYGFVAENAGSLAGANFLVLEELLGRGHRVDFYAIAGFVPAGRLEGRTGFRYFSVSHPAVTAGWRFIERLKGTPLYRPALTAFSLPANRTLYPRTGRAASAANAREPYSAVLALGLLCPFRVPGVRTVSWTQGTPNGEFGWMLANARSLARRAGPLLLPGAAGVYAGKYAEAFIDHRKSDVILCGSNWAVESWRRFGVPRAKLAPLPYPYDLAAFAPAPPPADKPPVEIRFLHLGRIVPRKRVDLLLQAFALFSATEPGARLDIVGGLSYGSRGDAAMLADPRYARGVSYTPGVPRADVPGLLARADAVVQPSENENFGSAPAEALAAGRPVLLGPTNGTKDYLGDAGVVFADYSPAAVAAGLAEIARRVRSDRAGLAAACRAAAERQFSLRGVVDGLERTLRGGHPA